MKTPHSIHSKAHCDWLLAGAAGTTFRFVLLRPKRAGLTMNDMGLMELNEAFAAQVLSCLKAFDSNEFAQKRLGLSNKIGAVSPDIVNVNGGAIALGHPVGATGTRLVIALMKEMRRRNVQFGLTTLCICGGQGGAMILEREA